MDVAGEHHHIGHAGVGEVLQHALALDGIAVPLVVVQHCTVQGRVGEDHRVADHVPGRLRCGERVEEPRLLIITEHRACRVDELRARWIEAQRDVSACLVAAVLAAIEQHEVDQFPPLRLAIDAVIHVRGDRCIDAHGLVLPPRLVRREAPIRERGLVGRRPAERSPA